MKYTSICNLSSVVQYCTMKHVVSCLRYQSQSCHEQTVVLHLHRPFICTMYWAQKVRPELTENYISELWALFRTFLHTAWARNMRPIPEYAKILSRVVLQRRFRLKIYFGSGRTFRAPSYFPSQNFSCAPLDIFPFKFELSL